MALQRQVHLIVAALPRDARWEIGRQVGRAAASTAANIAEGYGRPSRQDYRQYLSIARGENAEVDIICTRFAKTTRGSPPMLRSLCLS